MVYRTFDVPVAGGTLRVGQWGEGTEVLLAAHGLTGNHLHFQALAQALGSHVSLVAPDLRGRGRSNEVGGPYGMTAHADDLVAVLDHLGVRSALLLGHSMGAFVAVVTADRHRDRVHQLVLVDGGLPLDMTPLTGLSVEEVVRAVTGPVLDRLRMTFVSLEAYLDCLRPHPAFADGWNGYIEASYTYDLVGEAPDLHSSASEEAVLGDSASSLCSGDIQAALARITQPVVLVRAPRGMFNEVPPLYPDPVVLSGRAGTPQLTDVVLADVNHYSIVLSDRGAAGVARVVMERISASREPSVP